MDKCPACATGPNHTEEFEKIFSAIAGELEKRDINCIDDRHELATALSVLVADSLDIDVYK